MRVARARRCPSRRVAALDHEACRRISAVEDDAVVVLTLDQGDEVARGDRGTGPIDLHDDVAELGLDRDGPLLTGSERRRLARRAGAVAIGRRGSALADAAADGLGAGCRRAERIAERDDRRADQDRRTSEPDDGPVGAAGRDRTGRPGVPAGGRPVAARFAARWAERLSGRPMTRATGSVGTGGGVVDPPAGAGIPPDGGTPGSDGGTLPPDDGELAPGGIAGPVPRARGGTRRPRRRDGLMRQPLGRSGSRSPRTGAPRRG